MPKRAERKTETVKKKNPIGVAFGMLGASKGGKARAAKLSPDERKRIAKLAIKARWDKYKRSSNSNDRSEGAN